MSVRVGSLTLSSPVMTASGTAGHGDELAAYVDLSRLGAVVVKSLGAEPWDGQPCAADPSERGRDAQQRGPAGAGRRGLEDHRAAGAARQGSNGGGRASGGVRSRTTPRAAEAIGGCPDGVVAVEVNLSCPNLDGGAHLFAHDPAVTAQVLAVTESVGRPRWAKLSPNTDRLVDVAEAAAAAGAEAVTLVNTVMGMVIDTETRRPVLGGRSGGLSGPAIHPVAVRAVHDVHAALPELPIVGVGGVATAVDAVELMLAGASAVQVGTASFADPRSVITVLDGMETWCARHSVDRARLAHRSGPGLTR